MPADVRAAYFGWRCDTLLSAIRADAGATPGEAGAMVRVPLPLGPAALGRVPLTARGWVDRVALELAEAAAIASGRGFVWLPPADPHPLAWHRLYPPGTDWAAPREAGRDVADEAGRRLARCPAARRVSGGRELVRFADYAGWAGRSVPGDLVAAVRDGIVAGRWNEWVDAVGGGAVGYRDAMVSRLPNPCDFRAGRDFLPLGGRAADDQLEVRRRALGELVELAEDRTVRVRPDELLTPLQRKVLKLLETFGPLTGEELAEKARVLFGHDGAFSRRSLHMPGGIKELLKGDRPFVLKGRKGAGYDLARATPDPGRGRLH